MSKKPTRKEIINRNAFRAGTAAAKLRRAAEDFNEALLEAARTGITVRLVVEYRGIDDPQYAYIAGTMTRGKRGVTVELCVDPCAIKAI